MGASGPSGHAIVHASKAAVVTAPIQVIKVNEIVARRVLAAHTASLFSVALGDAPFSRNVIGRGDVLEITIWEAPPAVLFGANASFGVGSTASVLGGDSLGQRTALPEMMVDDDGNITVPFAGAISVAGRTPREVEQEIVARLRGKAHDPQVAVRLATNASADVTVVGDVATNGRIPLTPKGERLLDILAVAGGVKASVDKVTIQITRGNRVADVPLAAVIADPAQNIRLGPGDVVTALYQPYSFTALGATNKSAEIPFEATGLTVAQALGRVGGLKDDRANIRGAFIFRLEDPAALDPTIAATAPRTPDGRIPVIYQFDLSDPATFFAAQTFPMRNSDILYVSSAPLSDLQRFVGMMSSFAFTLLGLGQAIP
jgi:polysaccharide biosynthesis/export protein